MDAYLSQRLRALCIEHAGLPLPAGGRTARRWSVLADIADEDLVLVKLFEGHADAVAILAEIAPEIASEIAPGRASGPCRPSTDSPAVWAVWAAEPPDARLHCRSLGAGEMELSGTKAWCSGARAVTDALVTCWDETGRPWLAAVSMDSPGVCITDAGWHAVGMAGTKSVDVTFDRVRARAAGGSGEYLSRPGFWQGGAGIAACWYGGVLPLARAVRHSMQRRPEPHGLAHLGYIDIMLMQTKTLLGEAAAAIDSAPLESAQTLALRVRLAAEGMAREVSDRAARVLGAGPLCRDPALARRFADVPVFIRQSHAERDLAALGERLAAQSNASVGWSL